MRDKWGVSLLGEDCWSVVQKGRISQIEVIFNNLRSICWY
jgi:hypothetical protein